MRPKTAARLRWIVVPAGVALAVAAAPIADAEQAPRAAAIYTVTLQEMRFGATPASIHVGDAIEWVNADIFLHSATAGDHSFDVELKPKAHVRTTFRKAGRFPFACRYHPGMTGTVVVTN